MSSEKKHGKEWYRQAVVDFDNMNDAELLEKYGIRPRSRSTTKSRYRLMYATYDFLTPAEWVKTHTENELLEMVEYYKTHGTSSTCMKYEITKSFRNYFMRHGLTEHKATLKYPDNDTIIALVKKYGSVEKLIDNLLVELKDYEWITDSTVRCRFVSRIRKICEIAFDKNIDRLNMFGRQVPNKTRAIETEYNREEAKIIIDYANTHTIKETAVKFGIVSSTVLYLCNFLSTYYSIPYVMGIDKCRERAIEQFKDYKNLTIDAYVTKYGYANAQSARNVICQLKKKHNLKEEA